MIAIYIAIGGAIGSLLRYYTSSYIYSLFKIDFPTGTITVNIIGSLLMGLIVGYYIKNNIDNTDLKAFLTIGLLGGFTTFSAFSLDAMNLIEKGALTHAIIYIALSVFVSIVALFIGFYISRNFL